jgi:hypothetical protein
VSISSFGCITISAPYLRERGKNLATKKDVGELTEKVEVVRSAFAADLEDRKASHQLRAACLDRRLLAHQEAYTLWLDLVRMCTTTIIGT